MPDPTTSIPRARPVRRAAGEGTMGYSFAEVARPSLIVASIRPRTATPLWRADARGTRFGGRRLRPDHASHPRNVAALPLGDHGGTCAGSLLDENRPRSEHASGRLEPALRAGWVQRSGCMIPHDGMRRLLRAPRSSASVVRNPRGNSTHGMSSP